MTPPNDQDRSKLKQITLLGRTFSLPRSRLARTAVGVAFIIGGILGFLPILGFWMIPLGIIILSQDISAVRRFRRKFSVRASRWWATLRHRQK